MWGKPNLDWLVFYAAVLLSLFGVAMVFSSSAVLTLDRYGDPYFFLKRQALWVLMGLIGMGIAMRLDYRFLQGQAYPLLGVSVLLLLLVFIPPLGKSVAGARRWLRLGGITFQPAEVVKLTSLVYFSHTLTKKQAQGRLGNFGYGYLPGLMVVILLSVLILLQPDLGNALLIATVLFLLLFIAGVPLRFLLTSLLMFLPFLVLAVTRVPYRSRRLQAFWDPWSNAADSGYQLVQALIALGKGGLFGQGLGRGQQKMFYLPAPHTDFIFATIGEELGFVGGVTVVLCFALIIWFGFRIALRCRDGFALFLALGITLMLTLQVVINLGVVLAMLPPKGLPLPLVSAGGTSLLVNMFGIGILLSISRHNREEGDTAER